MNICLASMIWFGRGWVMSFIWLVSSRVPHLSGCVAVGTMACRKAVLQVDRRGSTPERLLRWLRWFFAPLVVFSFVLYMCSSRDLLFFRDLSRVCWLICPGWGLLVLLAPGLCCSKLLHWFPCRWFFPLAFPLRCFSRLFRFVFQVHIYGGAHPSSSVEGEILAPFLSLWIPSFHEFSP